MQMLDAGAVGYLLEGISATELVDAIERTAEHRPANSPDVTEGHGPDDRRPSPAEPITVIIADENQEFLEALASIIERAPDFALVGKARGARAAVRLAALYTPDVALVDSSMPGGGGSIAAAQIRSASPSTRVIALSASPERGRVLQMLRIGAPSYVVKEVPAQELLRSLRTPGPGRKRPQPTSPGRSSTSWCCSSMPLSGASRSTRPRRGCVRSLRGRRSAWSSSRS